jgi:hypothetical protein
MLSRSEFNCSICNQPVDLETAKTDDHGKAVHEQCYLLRHALKNATQPTEQQPISRPPAS